MDQLYLFEILIESIVIYDTREPLHSDDLKVVIEFSNIIKATIQSNKSVKGKNKYDLREQPFQSGKSVLFPTNSKNTGNIMEKQDLKLTILKLPDAETIGTVSIKWPKDFITTVQEIIEVTEDVRHSDTRAQTSGEYEILNSKKQNIGSVTIYMNIKSFGSKIEVDFQLAGSHMNIPRIKKRDGSIEDKTLAESHSDWLPLFITPYAERRSHMDPEMRIFAEMAGVVPPAHSTTEVLTPEYINSQLCGNRTCPGAVKFRDLGLGPLAPKGSGLGSIGTISEAKPCGVYGLSQAYGTLDNYGAYGLLLKKKINPKDICGSPDCPYTQLAEYPENNKAGSNSGKKRKKHKMCTCGCCKKGQKMNTATCGGSACQFLEPKSTGCGSPTCLSKNKKSKRNSQVVEDPTCGGQSCPYSLQNITNKLSFEDKVCGSPDCPYTTPKTISGACKSPICPSNQPRLSAGADDFDDYTTPKCCRNPCEFSTPNAPRPNYQQRSSMNYQTPLQPIPQPVGGMYIRRTSYQTPLQPIPQPIGGMQIRRTSYQTPLQPIPQPIGGMYIRRTSYQTSSGGYTSGNLDTTGFSSGICKDYECPFTSQQQTQSLSATGEGNCGGNVCPLSNFDETYEKELEQYKCNGQPCPISNSTSNYPTSTTQNCGDESCPFGRPKRVSYTVEEIPEGDQESTSPKRFSIVTNEEGKRMIIGTSQDGRQRRLSSKDSQLSKYLSKEFVGSISLADEEDIVMLIGRLAANRPGSQSMNNYYDGLEDRRLSKDTEESLQTETIANKKPRGPCRKDTCKIQKYPQCSECGGISRSGATCDNTNVSFTTISYDDIYNDESPEMEEEPMEKRKSVDKTKELLKQQHDQPNVPKKRPSVDKGIKLKKKRRSRFIYTGGQFYPGNRVGHRTCAPVAQKTHKNVPANMGWLWNLTPEGQLKHRRGWRPGVMSKIIAERVIEHRRERGIPDPPELQMLVAKKKSKQLQQSEYEDESDEEIEPKPTLIIQKKDGNYLITMNPLKDPKTIEENENPYIDCTPMQFLITKPKPPEQPAITNKYGDGEEGEDDYGTYYKDCLCDEDLDLQDNSSSSSESELNIEFTTPAGLIFPERMKRFPNVVHVDTQFKEDDFTCNDCVTIVPKIYQKNKKKVRVKK